MIWQYLIHRFKSISFFHKSNSIRSIICSVHSLWIFFLKKSNIHLWKWRLVLWSCPIVMIIVNSTGLCKLHLLINWLCSTPNIINVYLYLTFESVRVKIFKSLIRLITCMWDVCLAFGNFFQFTSRPTTYIYPYCFGSPNAIYMHWKPRFLIPIEALNQHELWAFSK